VKPAPGRTVPDPERAGYLPEAGEFVPRNAYWLRRIADKDVTEAKAPAKAKNGGEA
jgi:hypothetical protein